MLIELGFLNCRLAFPVSGVSHPSQPGGEFASYGVVFCKQASSQRLVPSSLQNSSSAEVQKVSLLLLLPLLFFNGKLQTESNLSRMNQRHATMLTPDLNCAAVAGSPLAY